MDRSVVESSGESHTRRQILGGIAAGALAALAGCQVTATEEPGGIRVGVSGGSGNFDVVIPVDPSPESGSQPLDGRTVTAVPSETTIESVDTSTAVFVGRPARSGGEVPSAPVLVDEFQEYALQFALPGDSTGVAETVGPAGPDGHNHLAWSVRLFFDNGGRSCYVVPTTHSVPTPTDLATLDDLEDGSILVAPGVTAPDDHARVLALVEGREASDLFYVGALPRQTNADGAPVVTSSYGALYYPWLTVEDPSVPNGSVAVPPVGAVAGIYARIDSDVGVFQSPAGQHADLSGIRGLDRTVDPAGGVGPTGARVNPLRALPDGSIVVWGSRTYSTDPGFPYVPIRRTEQLVRRSVEDGTRWVRSIPADEPGVARRVWTDVQEYLFSLWQRGYFQGNRPDAAYFVQTVPHRDRIPDPATTTHLVIRCGVAPLRPAEFLLVEVAQPFSR